MEVLLHGTCVALGGACALIRGSSGAGKSDLALRFLFLPGEHVRERTALVADDQVLLQPIANRLIASSPAPLAGKIEVRNIGIVGGLPAIKSAELGLIVDIDNPLKITRFPEKQQFERLLGFDVPRIALDPFEASAPIKLALFMRNFFATAAS